MLRTQLLFAVVWLALCQFAPPIIGVAAAQQDNRTTEDSGSESPDSGAQFGTPVPLGPVPGLSDPNGKPGNGVESEALRPPGLDAFGTVPRDAGGFAPGLWEGTVRALAEGLLRNLPDEPSSAVQRRLLHRLLLSPAVPPAEATNPFDQPGRGSGESEGNGEAAEGAFLDLRLDRLIAMGAVGEAIDLLMALPADAITADRLRRRVELFLIANRPEEACLEVRALGRTLGGSFWARARAFCQFLAGQPEKAQLTARVALETDPEQENFAKLVETLSFDDVSVERLPDATPIDFALWRLSGQAAPEDLFGLRAPASRLALAYSDHLEPEQRLRAIWRPALNGTLSHDVLEPVLLAVPFEEDDLERALTIVERDLEVGRRAFALLAQALAQAETDAGRAEVLNLAINELDGRTNSFRDWLVAKVDELNAAPELAWFGPSAAKLYYAANRPTAARKWYRLARQNTDPRLFDAIDRLWPMTVIAGHDGVSLRALSSWIDLALGLARRNPEAETEPPDSADKGRATRVLAVFDALGEPVTGDAWLRALSTDERYRITVPSTALLYRLENAALNGRIGETVAMTAVILGDDGARLTHSSLIVRTLDALQDAGLENEARALAIEAIARAVW